LDQLRDQQLKIREQIIDTVYHQAVRKLEDYFFDPQHDELSVEDARDKILVWGVDRYEGVGSFA
jgi:hypothetical protein